MSADPYRQPASRPVGASYRAPQLKPGDLIRVGSAHPGASAAVMQHAMATGTVWFLEGDVIVVRFAAGAVGLFFRVELEKLDHV